MDEKPYVQKLINKIFLNTSYDFSLVDEACIYAKSIKERFRREPMVTDFFECFPLFIDRDIEILKKYGFLDQITDKGNLSSQYIDLFINSDKQFENFESFIDYSNKK